MVNNMDISVELQQLKMDYAVLKDEMGKQKTVNEKFFRSMKRKSSFRIAGRIRRRCFLDLLTVPAIMIICINTHWPILLGFLVSLWCIMDLGIILWMKRKLGLNDLLNDNVQVVTRRINGYRKSYHRLLAIGIVLGTVMLTYIFCSLILQARDPENTQLMIIFAIVFILVAIVITIRDYRKEMRLLNELQEQFKEA